MIFDKRVEIFVHKRKMILFLVLAIILLAISIWMVFDDDGSFGLFGVIPVSNQAMGIFCSIVFAICIYFFIRKITRKLPVIVLDEKGIFEYLTQSSGVDIPWSAVSEVRTCMVVNHPFLAVSLYDPEIYLVQVNSNIKRKMLKLNQKRYDTPMMLSLRGIQIKPQELLGVIRGYLDAHTSAGNGKTK